MNYTSIADMANTIRANIWKVPNDVCLIVGVPRSGMIAALIVGEFLHKPVIDLQGFLDGREPMSGSRGKHMRIGTGRVLVLDDTLYTGRSMAAVRARIKANNVLFGCVYAEGKDATAQVDVWFENNYNPNEELWHLYEWNILHHGEKLSKRSMFDLDGVLCLDPPDERKRAEYEQYIANAKPLVVPTTPIGAIVTYRLEAYRNATQEWLRQTGIQYGCLHMRQNANTRSHVDAARYKAEIYAANKWALLFVESAPLQAEIIAAETGKQVFCYSNAKLY